MHDGQKLSSAVTLGQAALVALTMVATLLAAVSVNAAPKDPARIAGLSCLSGGMLFCIYANPMLCDWFRMPVSRWLGRISFPLYLLHFPVLASFTCGMVVLADHAGMLNNWIMGAIIAASVAISLALAVAFGPVEKFTRIVGDALCRRLIA